MSLRSARFSFALVMTVLATTLVPQSMGLGRPAAAAATSQIVIHKPGTANVVPDTTVSVALGSSPAADFNYIAGDSYGAFALVPTAASTRAVTINGKAWDVRSGREIWLNNAGDPFSSRAAAQGYVTVHFRIAAGTGADASMSYVDDGAVATGTITSQEAGSTATEAIFHIPVAAGSKTISLQPKILGAAVGAARLVDSSKWGEVWVSTAYIEVRTSQSWADGFVTFHYRRPAGDYFIDQASGCAPGTTCTPWGMHVWDGAKNKSASWGSPTLNTGRDAFGLIFKIELAQEATAVSFLFHRGDTKDPFNGGSPKDQSLDVPLTGGEVWFVSENCDDTGKAVYAAPVIPSVDADLTLLKAIWVNRTTIAWPDTIRTVDPTAKGVHATLVYSESGNLHIAENPTTKNLEVAGIDESFDLVSGSSLPSAITDSYKHLTSYRKLTVPAAAANAAERLLRGQVAVMVTNDTVNADTNPDGLAQLVRLTGLQLAPVLDNIYGTAATSAQLGVTWAGTTPTLRVWAPTAKSVSITLYADATAEVGDTLAMTRDDASGVWSLTGDPTWTNHYFVYNVEVYTHYKTKVVTNHVTDPYSLSLSMNSLRTQIFDPSDLQYWPDGLSLTSPRPAFTTIKDATLYELHVRDFSIKDQSVPASDRGTYMAFTHLNSDGMKHLADLADAGLTHLHLMPTFDIASVDEDRSTWQTTGDLSGFSPDSEAQQAAVSAISETDGYNWGYDPYHFNAPEGSYATAGSVDGGARILEFRKMIKGLTDVGLRNVLDVVYNHTNSSGQNGKSVFDKIVPGYYYRLANDGTVTTSTCCQNTATENIMMAKFTRESILSWVKYFRIDGFRFDLMGHMPKSLLVAIRSDLDKLTVANDGVDGKSIVLYGEGWNFGEVANNARFIQSTQGNMNNTGVAVYDDRIRDAARGGGPFDNNPAVQGFLSGAYIAWNHDPVNGKESIERMGALLNAQDLVKLGLVGMLAKYDFVGADGFNTSGTMKQYQGKAAGFTQNPTDQIAYVDKHDNEAMYDWLAYKLPIETSHANRVRYQVLALATPTLSQGVPFWMGGSDIMRSKSLDKNSYNSGDWFNAIDWSMTDNGFGHGLPMKGDNGSRWDLYAQPLLAQANTIKPTHDEMLASTQRWQEFLKIRYASPLFRLGTGSNVRARVKFLNSSGATPGVISMQILDGTKTIKKMADLDPKYRSIVVVMNVNQKAKSITFTKDTSHASLISIQKNSVDPVVRTAKIVATKVKQGKKTVTVWKATVPALTAAVFVTY